MPDKLRGADQASSDHWIVSVVRCAIHYVRPMRGPLQLTNRVESALINEDDDKLNRRSSEREIQATIDWVPHFVAMYW